MSTLVDRHGNRHRAAGTAGAGQFAPHAHTAPASGLADVEAEEHFDETEWRERMEAVIDAGEPEGSAIAGALDANWAETPF